MGINKRAISTGTPVGKNKFVIRQRCSAIPTILMPIKWDAAKKNVTINELVSVKEYGIKPTKLDININQNKNNKIEKYSYRLSKVFVLMIFLTTKNIFCEIQVQVL